MDCAAAATSKVHSVTQSHATTLSGGYPVALAKRSWVYASCSCCLLPTSCIKICHIQVNAMISFLDSISSPSNLGGSWPLKEHIFLWNHSKCLQTNCSTLGKTCNQTFIILAILVYQLWNQAPILLKSRLFRSALLVTCGCNAKYQQGDVEVCEKSRFFVIKHRFKTPFSPHQTLCANNTS